MKSARFNEAIMQDSRGYRAETSGTGVKKAEASQANDTACEKGWENCKHINTFPPQLAK